MERELLDMTNQLFISEYNSRVDYGDQFQFVTPKYIILTNKGNIFIIIPKLIKSLSRHG